MRRKICIIGCTGIPARYGGFETFAEQIALKLRDDFEIHVACSRYFYGRDERALTYKQINRFFIRFKANGICSVIYDLLSLIKAIRKTSKHDTIILLGIGPGIYLPFIKAFYKRKILVHIDGMEWKRSKWNLLISSYLKFCRNLALRFSDQVIIDNVALKAQLPEKYIPKYHLIQYGGEHLLTEVTEKIEPYTEFALAVARAEPENQLELILSAFSEMTGTELQLVLISNFNANNYGRRLKRKYGNYHNILLKEAIYSQPALLNTYRKKCKIYLHAHTCGGTNPSLVEAMYFGKPIIAADNLFNRYTTNHQARYFQNKPMLKELINKLMKNENNADSLKMQEYARLHYSWDKVKRELMKIL